MATYMSEINQHFVNLTKGSDDVVDSWFLMSTPGPVFIIVAIYLVFVLKTGPSYMKNREAFKLKNTMFAYNAFQVLFSMYVFRISLGNSLIIQTMMSEKCDIHRTDQQRLNLHIGAWFYFFSKMVDLLDTFFIVLRKKQNQVSFLHVYHHTLTALSSWLYLKYTPGEQGVVIGILNSGVHIIMYFYYMVAAMGPQYQKYLWWKKYMTTIQLVQFVLIMAYMVAVTMKGCNMPMTLTVYFIINTVIFLYLFGNFYRKTYNSKKGGSAGGAALQAAGGFGCLPTTSFIKQADQNDNNNNNNNNNMKSTKTE